MAKFFTRSNAIKFFQAVKQIALVVARISTKLLEALEATSHPASAIA